MSRAAPGPKSITPVTLECQACGAEVCIPPQNSLRTFSTLLNRFKRTHNCCSIRSAVRAARRKRLN